LKFSSFFSIVTNIVAYYLFRKKPFSDSDQRNLWLKRNIIDYEFNDEIERDPYYQLIDKYILDNLKNFSTDNYLEIGCYYGYRLNKFSSSIPDKLFAGIDIGHENLLLAKKIILKNNENIFLVNCDARFIPFKDESFETVYTVVCLTHIDYKTIKKAINEIIRVCSKNIFLIEVDHSSMSFFNKMKCLGWRYGYIHSYEKLINNKAKLISIQPLYDFNDHPRYTAFKFIKIKD